MNDNFKDRLKQELKDLEEKSTKLDLFLSKDTSGIDPQQVALLRVQAKIMLAYAQVLNERLNIL